MASCLEVQLAKDTATLNQGRHHGQYADSIENLRGYCPNHSTGVKLPDDFVVTPLQYVD
jgi:hypothetical protein